MARREQIQSTSFPGPFYNVDAPVGPGARNRRDDVMLVQFLLKRYYKHFKAFKPQGDMVVDGLCGPTTSRVMPAFLATVPLTLPLESSLPQQYLIGMPLLETIEQRATAEGIAVDSRVQAGRTYRHALARLLEHEQFDRVIISATGKPRVGLSGPDLLWLLDHTQAEVMILRPAPQDTHIVSTSNLKGHF